MTSETAPCVSDLPDGFAVHSQCGTFIDADGDALAVDIAPYELHVNATFSALEGMTTGTVNGGTGKFKDATGSLTFSNSQDLATGVVATSYDGTVKF